MADRPTRWPAIALFGFGAAVAVGLLSAEWLLGRPGVPGLLWPPRPGVDETLLVVRHIDLPAMAVLLALTLCAGVLSLVQREAPVRRASFEYSAWGAALGFAVIFGAESLAFPLRQARLEAAAPTLDSLAGAIDAFHEDTGHYPGTLDSLSPRYVPNAQRLAIRGCRSPQMGALAGDPWKVWFDCPNGFMALDRLEYSSVAMVGPARAWRVGRWRYILD